MPTENLIPAPASGTVADIPDARHVERAVNAAHVGHDKAERWVHVMRAFSLGSTYAQQLCRRFALDPYEEVGTEPVPDEDDDACDIIKVVGSDGEGWTIGCCEEHDPLMRVWDTAEDARAELGADLEWWEEDRGVWMADAAGREVAGGGES